MRVYNIVYDIFGGFGGMGLQDILSSKILEVSSMASSSCRDRSSTTSCGQTHESWLNHPPKQRSIELDDFAKKPPCVQGFQEVPMFEDTEGYCICHLLEAIAFAKLGAPKPYYPPMGGLELAGWESSC